MNDVLTFLIRLHFSRVRTYDLRVQMLLLKQSSCSTMLDLNYKINVEYSHVTCGAVAVKCFLLQLNTYLGWKHTRRFVTFGYGQVPEEILKKS